MVSKIFFSDHNNNKAVMKELNKDKPQRVDGISIMLKHGGEALLEWLTRVCRVCVAEESVFNDTATTEIYT